MAGVFDHMPRDARSHFRLNFYAAVYYLVHHLRRLSEAGGEQLQAALERYPFMGRYFKEMLAYMPDELSWSSARRWWEEEITAWEGSSEIHLPLLAVPGQGDVPFLSRMALMLVGMVEEDSRFGTLFAKLQEPLAYRRPCLELLGQVVMDDNLDGPLDAWAVCRPLLSAGVLEVVNGEAPRSEWELRVPSMLWDVARGQEAVRPSPWCHRHPPEDFPRVTELFLSDDFLERLRQVPELVTTGKANVIVLRGMQGSERVTILGSVARALGRGVVEVHPFSPREREGERAAERPWPSERWWPTERSWPTEGSWPLVGPLCSMTRSIPVITCDLGPGETAEVPSLTGYEGPVGVLMGFEGGLTGRPAEKALTLTVPLPGAAQRRRFWEAALGSHMRDLTEVSERFRMPGGYIRQAGSMAIAHAALDGRKTVQISDIREACRALNRQLLDTLATRLEPESSWAELIVSEATGLKLRELEQRCRHREKLVERLSKAFGFHPNRGVRALFTGPSGTGKTMAARILAAELGMDVYRVDLGAVVNKYIGETEKNLHRVLSRAEELDIILLLDEGDALLSNRTEVKSANDRYANLETNYLLQRLENYQGIVIVTTNAAQYIDNAFQRRMDVVVNFVPPQAEERWVIWQLHLPADHAVEEAYLEEIALRCILTGGQIRNAALHATLLALDDGGGHVRRHHLEQAVRNEYRKAGAICPLGENGRAPTSHGGMAAFWDALRA
jgi:hypothetical protein